MLCVNCEKHSFPLPHIQVYILIFYQYFLINIYNENIYDEEKSYAMVNFSLYILYSSMSCDWIKLKILNLKISFRLFFVNKNDALGYCGSWGWVPGHSQEDHST